MSRDIELEDLPRMTSEEDDLGVQDFLDAFALALIEGQHAAVAAMWETPGFVIGETFAYSIDDEAQLRDFSAQARERYNSRGVTNTRPQIVRLDEITDRLVSVRVRWPWLDSDDMELGGECVTYTLRADDNGEWRIRVALIHGPEAVS